MQEVAREKKWSIWQIWTSNFKIQCKLGSIGGINRSPNGGGRRYPSGGGRKANNTIPIGIKKRWHTPKLLDGFNYESKCENNGRIKSEGTSLGSQHFGCRKACWSSRMGTKTSDKSVNYSHGLAQIKQQVG